VETIISPQAILASSDVLVRWTQTGHKDGSPGMIRFDSDSGLFSIAMYLENCDGLYYCPTDVFTVDSDPVRCNAPVIHRALVSPAPVKRRSKDYSRVSHKRLTESELWMLRLGSPGEDQLDLLHSKVTGIPHGFQYHPFRFIDWKEEARVQKQAAGRAMERTSEVGRRFYMDFGFMRASSSDYTKPNKKLDRVVDSWDGYLSYLLIVDEASRYIWVFLTRTKEPPLDIIDTFLDRFGHKNGGSIRSDQGRELARSFAYSNLLLRKYHYVVEPTGADSPSQNGAAEIYNAKLAVRTRTLLFGSDLPAKYWSSALVHAVYLHNRLVHTVTWMTPFESFFGAQPDLSCLKLFGSWVCVKRTGSRRSKLDCHDFKGIFLGYTATDQNIIYLDLDSGLVKSSHHAQFDEAWYLQPQRPPAAQLLYDLGILPEADLLDDNSSSHVPWPPLAPTLKVVTKWYAPPMSKHLHLPLRTLTDTSPRPTWARAARTKPTKGRNLAAELVDDFQIGVQDMKMVYMSPDPYHDAFAQTVDLRKFDLTKHATGGLNLYVRDGRIHLGSIAPSTPTARIHGWWTRIRGAWLIKVGDIIVESIDDVVWAFDGLRTSGSPSVTLLFSHPEVKPNLSQDGLPIVSSAPFTQLTHNQLNN